MTAQGLGLSCASPIGAPRAVSRPKQEPRKIRAAPIVQVTAQGANVSSSPSAREPFVRRFLLRDAGEVRASFLVPVNHSRVLRIDANFVR